MLAVVLCFSVYKFLYKNYAELEIMTNNSRIIN